MKQQVTKPVNQSARIRAILALTPNAVPKEIARKARTSVDLVYEVKSQLRKKASTGAKLPNIVRQATAEVKQQVNTEAENKNLENFAKAVALIHAYGLNYNLGSAVACTLKSNSENKRANINAAIWHLKNELLTTPL
jgi:hypothetical protein